MVLLMLHIQDTSSISNLPLKESMLLRTSVLTQTKPLVLINIAILPETQHGTLLPAPELLTHMVLLMLHTQDTSSISNLILKVLMLLKTSALTQTKPLVLINIAIPPETQHGTH
jgi:hypothetical protein